MDLQDCCDGKKVQGTGTSSGGSWGSRGDGEQRGRGSRGNGEQGGAEGKGRRGVGEQRGRRSRKKGKQRGNGFPWELRED